MGWLAGAHGGHRLWHGLLRQNMPRARRDFDDKRVVVSGRAMSRRMPWRRSRPSAAGSSRCRTRRLCRRRGRHRLDLLKDVKERRRERLSVYAEERGGAVRTPLVARSGRWPATSRCPAPPRTNSPRRARRRWWTTVSRRRRRGREHALHPEAVKIFQDAKVLFAPGKASTPAASRRPRSRCSRTPAAVRGASTRPRPSSRRSWLHPRRLRETAEEYAAPATTSRRQPAGYLRVADAMVAQGVI